MNSKHYFYLFLTILSVGVFASCDDDDDKDEYPKTVEVGNLLVSNTQVSVYNFKVEEESTFHILNSDEELFNFWVPIPNDQELPLPTPFETNVDYTKKSVLLIGGKTSNNISMVEVNCVQESSLKYNVKMTVHLASAGTERTWAVPIVVPKMDSTIQIINAEIEYISPKLD